MIQRSISEVGNEEKVQIHFKFTEQHKGYAFTGREHALDNCDIFLIVQEIDKMRANRAHNLEVKHVYRRVFINKHKNKPVVQRKQKEPKQVRRENTERKKELNAGWVSAFENAKQM